MRKNCESDDISRMSDEDQQLIEHKMFSFCKFYLLTYLKEEEGLSIENILKNVNNEIVIDNVIPSCEGVD